VLPLYLATLGFSALQIGLLATATLAGSSLLTLSVGLVAHRLSGRALLRAASVLMGQQRAERHREGDDEAKDGSADPVRYD
jgi:hypothetical protein